MDVRWSTAHFLRIILLLLSLFRYTITFKQQGGCFFPERWVGTWFQSGVRQPIIIEGPRLSSKGMCLGSEGDKFLVVDDKRVCYRCVVIHEKHANVLQYKETFCQSREVLPTLCSLITGDALLYSMFRENATPVPCPFHGPFSFTYNRGHGECKSPVSSIDTCTEESRLLLSYQACPDIHGSESTVEELQCLAIWKEGNSRYLVGKVHHNHATSNEDRFRCFVYEKVSSTSEAINGVEYRVAQSGDATCNGLSSATEGSRTMTLKKVPALPKCRFPMWISSNNHWHTLDYSFTYSFHHKNSTLRITNSSSLEMKIICAQLKHATRDESFAIFLTHFTTGCSSGYTCMSFYRRDSHVMEVQIGGHTKRQEDACTSLYFNKTSLAYVTLVTSSPEPRQCPYFGKFSVDSMISNKRYIRSLKQSRSFAYFDRNRYFKDKFRSSQDTAVGLHNRRIKRVEQRTGCDNEGYSSLIVGCNSIDTMEFRIECPPSDFISSYSCHGQWEENGINYLITTPLSRSSYGARRYCFIYREHVPGTVLFSTSPDNCERSVNPGISGELIFNVTNTGKCMEISGSEAIASSSWGKFLLLITFLHLIINLR